MKTALVIDDDDEIRANLAEILHLEGLNVAAAKDGRKGLEIAMSTPPDLIVCDIEMPDFDGVMVYQSLQQDTRTASIPFIFITGAESISTVQKKTQIPSERILMKPFNLSAFIRLVHQLIQSDGL